MLIRKIKKQLAESGNENLKSTYYTALARKDMDYTEWKIQMTNKI